MEPPTCTGMMRSVRTTGAVATEPPPSDDEAGLPRPPLVASATPAAAPAARTMMAMTTTRLVNKIRVASNLAIAPRPSRQLGRSRRGGAATGESSHAGLHRTEPGGVLPEPAMP